MTGLGAAGSFVEPSNQDSIPLFYMNRNNASGLENHCSIYSRSIRRVTEEEYGNPINALGGGNMRYES